jgi:hypothetical protein
VALTGLLLVCACATAPPPDAVTKFGTALGSITTSTSAAFQAAQDVEAKENRAVLLAALSCRAADCPPIMTLAPDNPILTPALLENFYRVLRGINAYGKTLTSLTSPETAMLISSSTNSVGASLKGLSTQLSATTSGRINGLSGADIDQGARAIGALGDFLVQERINAEIPRVIAANHPTIVNLTKYLNAVIGSPGEGANAGSGLRGIIQLKMQRIDRNLAVLIERMRREPTVGNLELIEYAQKVYEQNVDEANQADDALAEVQTALAEMVTAHAALLTPSDPSTFEKIQSFTAFTLRAEAAVNAATGKN